MEKNNKNRIDSLLKKIEAQLQWGKSAQWSSYDFEKLAALIFESTKIAISSNTLKRVWGRIKYESTPSDMTLNTLASFAGYEDYRDFINKTESPDTTPISEVRVGKWKWPLLKTRPSVIFVSGAIFMLAALIVLSYRSSKRTLNPDEFYFTSRKVTTGLPNSVLFDYRARNAPANAKVEIQQSWDKNKKMSISRQDTLATSIYHDPGYFNAKLVIDGQTVKEHGVLIPSEGWTAKVEGKENTLYFRDSSLTKSGKVFVDKRLLSESGIDRNEEPLATTFRYVDDFADLRVNDMRIETVIRNTSKSNRDLCQKSSITLLMEGEAIRIPFAKMGCISELELWHLDRTISGKNNDLSKLGVDFDESVAISFIVRKDWLTVNIYGKKALELSMKGRINKFHGMIYRFEGSGEVSSLQIENSGKIYLQWAPEGVGP